MTKGPCPQGPPVLGVSQVPWAPSWWPILGVHLAAEGVSPPRRLLVLEKGHVGGWRHSEGTSHVPSPRCGTPPARWPHPAPKKPPGGGWHRGRSTRCVPMLRGALTWLRASVSPARPEGGADGDGLPKCPAGLGGTDGPQHPRQPGGERATTPLSPRTKLGAVPSVATGPLGSWQPQDVAAAGTAGRARICSRLPPAQWSWQGWRPPSRSRAGDTLELGDVSVAHRGQRVTPQPCHHLLHQPG